MYIYIYTYIYMRICTHAPTHNIYTRMFCRRNIEERMRASLFSDLKRKLHILGIGKIQLHVRHHMA